MGAAEDEGAIGAALLDELESVHLAVPEKEDPPEKREVPGENAHLDSRRLAALGAENAVSTEPVSDVTFGLGLGAMEPQAGEVDEESDALDRGAKRPVRHGDARSDEISRIR